MADAFQEQRAQIERRLVIERAVGGGTAKRSRPAFRSVIAPSIEIVLSTQTAACGSGVAASSVPIGPTCFRLAKDTRDVLGVWLFGLLPHLDAYQLVQSGSMFKRCGRELLPGSLLFRL